jgi:hypothetical protein
VSTSHEEEMEQESEEEAMGPTIYKIKNLCVEDAT